MYFIQLLVLSHHSCALKFFLIQAYPISICGLIVNSAPFNCGQYCAVKCKTKNKAIQVIGSEHRIVV